MANGGKDRSSRESRERARLYQARQEFHSGQSRRRTRDNLVAGIVGGLLILGVVGAQTAYFVAGPGAPVPAPTNTGVTPTPTVTSTPTPTSSTTPTPTPTP
ncbi:dioxygenase [Microbacterium sp. SSM24]|uniref:dioxygenase n=1 Tax=Microbacterium sp. SSM24 TaxID=2991714 RepID=UPI00222608D4|nr:dioxygenase [Microbacterium sp. SSM24]MCW3494529.1 dioxygenase [Microbacterium sp. SSM24]